MVQRVCHDLQRNKGSQFNLIRSNQINFIIKKGRLKLYSAFQTACLMI